MTLLRQKDKAFLEKECKGMKKEKKYCAERPAKHEPDRVVTHLEDTPQNPLKKEPEKNAEEG